MEEWKEYKLGDVLTIKYGKDHKQIADGNIPIYGSGGIIRYGARSLYDGPSVLIPRKGSLNNIMFANYPFWTVDTMFWTIINEDIANPLFVYYSICTKGFASLNVGSAVPSLTVPVIENIDILLPSKTTQDKVVTILKSLDDKIELNRRINDNLEQQAQALFKSWFIDFEPFGGKMPKDWKMVKMSEIIQDIAAGPFGSKLPKSCFTIDGTPIIDGANLKGRIINESFSKFVSQSKSRELWHSVAHKGDFVVTISGTIGQIAYIHGTSGFSDYIVSQRQFRFSLNNEKANRYYISLYFANNLGKQKILSFGNQVGVPALSQPLKNFKNIDIMLPNLIIQNQFGRIVEHIDSLICRNKQELTRLAALRDTLLPKLMSGELIPE